MDASPSLVLLGSPHIQRAGTRFDLPDALPGYLVAYLAARGDWVLREEIAVLLWPEAAESEAQNNLRVNLTRLRPHLARWGIDSLFVAERRRLRLDLDSDVRAVRAAHARGAWVETAEAARGQFLDGMSFRAFAVLGEWARSEREALRALWRDAVLRAGDAIAPQSRLDLASRYLSADPFDEDIVHVQLGALATLGRSDEAQRLFARFSEQVRAELGVDVTAALAEYARRLGRPAAGEAASAVRPDADEPLIGREAELAAIAQLVSDTPLVTVVGLGGIGKTRLARALQLQLAPQFSDGVLWLSLIELSGVAEIVRRLADLLQIQLSGGRDAVEQIIEHIGERMLLLVLDNAEHLLVERAALNALLTQMLGCPQLHCLVTSREALNHPRERPVRLEGLAVPDENAGAAALGTAAVRLFVQQAQRRRPAFDPRGAVADLARIARLTGGMPLALRIAAGWAGFLSCADIAAEIRRGLDALEPGSGEPAGVRATLARSWNRLSTAEQSALAALSVFSSPFTAQAAREVAQAALPVLGSLTERCLLLPSEAGDDTDRARFEMHPLVRSFAAEQLAADPRAQRQSHDRHASHVMRMLAPWADFRLVADQRKGLLVFGNLLPEALAAWRWALAAGRSDYIAAAARVLANYFELKGRWDEGIALLTGAEPQLDAEERGERAALAAVTGARAQLLHRIGHPDAEDVARRALEGSRSIGHRAGIRSALSTLGDVLLQDGRHTQALETYREALDMARADADRASEAAMINGIALARLRQGDSAAAETLWRESLTLLRDVGNWIAAVRVCNNLGCLLTETGRFDEAQAMLDEGLKLCDTVGIAALRPVLLGNLSDLHLTAGRLPAATTFAELAMAESRGRGDRQAQIWSLQMLVEIALKQRDAGRIAEPLRDALRLARASGDVQNVLALLRAYAGWSLLRDRRETAALVWLAVLAHPRLDAQNRKSAEQQWEAAVFDDELVAAARRNAQGSDALALVEQALVELDRSAAASPSSITRDSAAGHP